MTARHHWGGNKGFALLPRSPFSLGSHTYAISHQPIYHRPHAALRALLPFLPSGPAERQQNHLGLSKVGDCRKVASERPPTGRDMASCQSPGPWPLAWVPRRGTHATGNALTACFPPALPSLQEEAPSTVSGSLSHTVHYNPPPGNGPSTGPGLGQCPSALFLSVPPPIRFGQEAWALATFVSCSLVISTPLNYVGVLGRVQVA